MSLSVQIHTTCPQAITNCLNDDSQQKTLKPIVDNQTVIDLYCHTIQDTLDLHALSQYKSFKPIPDNRIRTDFINKVLQTFSTQNIQTDSGQCQTHRLL